MRYKIENTLIYVAGGLLILIGIVGLFLPLLQGILFIALGLYVLSLRSVRARRLLDRVLVKFPSINKFTQAFKTTLKKIFSNQN